MWCLRIRDVTIGNRVLVADDVRFVFYSLLNVDVHDVIYRDVTISASQAQGVTFSEARRGPNVTNMLQIYGLYFINNMSLPF